MGLPDEFSFLMSADFNKNKLISFNPHKTPVKGAYITSIAS